MSAAFDVQPIDGSALALRTISLAAGVTTIHRRAGARLAALRDRWRRAAVGRRRVRAGAGTERRSRRSPERTPSCRRRRTSTRSWRRSAAEVGSPRAAGARASSSPRSTQRMRRPATGARSFQILFGPHNGSTRATLFAGFIPPGKAPWHYHLYDEIVWVPEGPGRLHLAEGSEELGAGAAFRLRPRQVHIVENARRARADDHRDLHAGREPVGRVPHGRRRRRVPLRGVARGDRDAGHVERGSPAPCAEARRLGRRADRRRRAPRARRPDSRRRSRTPARELVHAAAAPGRRAPRRPRRRARRVPAHGVGDLERRRNAGRVGSDRRRRLHLPHARPPRRTRAARADCAVRAHRRVVLRHDDGRRRRHVGGGAWRDRRGAHGRRPRPRGRARGVRLLPAAGPPRDAVLVRRLVLPEQRGRGRAAPPRARGGTRRTPRRRRAPRQRRAGDLLGARRRAHSARCTSIPAQAGSRTSSASPTSSAPRTSTSRCARARATTSGSRGSTASSKRPRAHASEALVVALGVDAAADDPNSPLAVTRRRVSRSRATARLASACRPSSSRRAATCSRRSARSSGRPSRASRARGEPRPSGPALRRGLTLLPLGGACRRPPRPR